MITIKKNKIEGMIYGAAVGDCVGSYTEFMTPKQASKTIKKLDDVFSRHNVFKMPYGYFTDDTSMALIALASLVKNDALIFSEIMKLFSKWRNEGFMSSTDRCFDIGGQTSSAISVYEKSGSDGVLYAPDGLMSHGNGSLMRIYPLALFLAGEEDDMYNDHMVEVLSSMTHSGDICVEMCQVFVECLIALLRGGSKDEVRTIFFDNPNCNINLINNGAYVIDSLNKAVSVFLAYDNYESGLLKITCDGDDADTVGTIYGALAGCFYGVNSIPKNLINNMQGKRSMQRLADKAYSMWA
jgi:ADP-ribosyl-[dinitrogen reductase] hydrolase